MCRCTDIMFFQNPPYGASRQLMIPRIAGDGNLFSPLPCQAWHGYMVTNAHRVEVEAGADGPASAPLSGAAAASSPAGALLAVLYSLLVAVGRPCRCLRRPSSLSSHFSNHQSRPPRWAGMTLRVVTIYFHLQ
jgi:hypothetical protein